MLYDLSFVLPLFVVLTVLAVAGSVLSLAVLGRTLAVRDTAERQGLPAGDRRFDLAV